MQDDQLELSTVARRYRKTGFEESKLTAMEIAESVDAEAVFPAAVQIRVRHKKRLFDYESRSISRS